MPGRRCAIFSCNNSCVVTKAEGKDIMYHNFPKDETVRDEWVRLCNRAPRWNPATSQICSVHFSENDYERDLQNELLGRYVVRDLCK